MNRRIRSRSLASLTSVAAFAACSTAPPPQTAAMRERGDIEMPASQLRVLV